MQKTQKIIIGLLCTGSIGVMVLAGCPGENKPGGGNLANSISQPQATVDDVKLSFMNVKDAIKKYFNSTSNKGIDKFLMASYSGGSGTLNLLDYESDKLQGEYTDTASIYFYNNYNYSSSNSSREQGTITYTKDNNNLLKSLVIKDSSNKELVRLNYSLIDNPSLTGTVPGDTVKGANIDAKFYDSICNDASLNGNVIVGGEFDDYCKTHNCGMPFKNISAVQLSLNGKCGTQNLSFSGNAYDFTSSYYSYSYPVVKPSGSYSYPTPTPSPINQKPSYPPGVIANMPGTIKVNMNYPGYILSSVTGDFNYDWKNTKNITSNANFTFNNEYWIASVRMDYDTTTSSSSFPYNYKSFRGTLENSTKNYIISVNVIPSKSSYGDWNWSLNSANFSGDITSNGIKLADISIKEVPDKYGYKVKTPVITYTDGTELSLNDYANELSAASGSGSVSFGPAPVAPPRPSASVKPYASPSAWVTATPYPYASVAPTVAPSVAYPYPYPSVAPSAYPSASVAPSAAPAVTVTLTQPDYNATDIAPNTSFKLTFYTDVDKASVQDNFAIFTNEHLHSYNSFTKFTTGFFFLTGSSQPQVVVYDKNAYNFSWSGNTEVTITPKNSRMNLPTDQNTSVVPQYLISFKNPFKSLDGISCFAIDFMSNTGPFNGKAGVPFRVIADSTPPVVDSVGIIDSSTVKIRFSEAMGLTPLNGNLIEMADVNVYLSQTYSVKIDTDNDGVFETPLTISSNGILDDSDIDKRTVKFTVGTSLGAYTGKKVRIAVDSTKDLMDPAGNLMGTNASVRGGEIVVP